MHRLCAGDVRTTRFSRAGRVHAMQPGNILDKHRLNVVPDVPSKHLRFRCGLDGVRAMSWCHICLERSYRLSALTQCASDSR